MAGGRRARLREAQLPGRSPRRPPLLKRGWVLAGGRSSRFGSDKALHLVDGVPLVVRTVRVLEAAGARAGGLRVGVVARHPRHLGLDELLEPDGPRHPLWGVAAALAEGDALFCPVDLPALTPDQVRPLLGRPAYALAQPLLGWFPATLRDRALRLAGSGGRVRDFVADLPGLDVGPLPNLNVPGEPAG